MSEDWKAELRQRFKDRAKYDAALLAMLRLRTQTAPCVHCGGPVIIRNWCNHCGSRRPMPESYYRSLGVSS